MTQRTPIAPRTLKRAFTFVEIMFVLVIAGFVSLGRYQFVVDSSKSLFTSTQKNEITDDIRQFTGEMTSIARSSNAVFVYKSFVLADRDAVADRLRDGQSGDFVLFVFVNVDSTSAANPDRITRLVGYFRRPDLTDPEGKGPVLKFDIKYPSGMSVNTYTPESLINSLSYNGTYPSVVQLSKGLANGKLFYNYFNRSVMVKAQIVHGNKAKRITDTYNFTITPRG